MTLFARKLAKTELTEGVNVPTLKPPFKNVKTLFGVNVVLD